MNIIFDLSSNINEVKLLTKDYTGWDNHKINADIKVTVLTR